MSVEQDPSAREVVNVRAEDSQPQLVELNFSSKGELEEDTLGETRVLWKDILKEGDLARTPGLRRKRPLKIVPRGESSVQDGTISMSDIMKAYDERAFEDVTIPDGHPKEDSGLDNTGYVNGLRVVKRDGKHYLQAALGFTEPDVAAKVRRGSVPNVSSGILVGFRRKHDDRYFRAALNHVALTKTPFIHGLNPFTRVYCSDEMVVDADKVEVLSAEFAEEGQTRDNTAEIVWNEQNGANWLRDELSTALQPDQPQNDALPSVPRPWYSVNDVSQTEGLALVDEYFRGDRTRFVIPFTISDDKVSPAPATRWVEVREAMIAASDNPVDFAEVSSEKLREKLNVALSEALEDDSYRVDEITLDRRVRVRKDDGATFMTEFAVTDVGGVLIAPVSEWDRLSSAERPAKKAADDKHPAKRVELSDSPFDRVSAARERRRQMMTLSR